MLRGPFCEVRDCHGPGIHLHHVFFHRMADKPELNVAENAQIVCLHCHDGPALNYEKNQREFWLVQCERYDMMEWWEHLDLISKERFW